MQDFFAWLREWNARQEWSYNLLGGTIFFGFAFLIGVLVWVIGSALLTPADPNLMTINAAIEVYHDATRHVTCWLNTSGGIACLPDSPR